MSAVSWWAVVLVLGVLLRGWAPADGYSDGKVTKSCGNMEPRHGAAAQTTPSPYWLSTNTSLFSPGDSVQVNLTGTFFEGFLLQARDATNRATIVGSFTLTDTIRTQLLTCENIQGSAVSHTSDARQQTVVVEWNAPADAPKEVQFFATVVAHYSTFWLKVAGPTIHQPGVTPHPPYTTTTAAPPPPTTTPSILPEPFSSEGCGREKSCLMDPPGCHPEKPGCFFLSMTTQGPNQQSVMFEMSGPADGYVSFALSWDTWMGDDDVYICVRDGQRVSVLAAYVKGRTHPEDETQSGLSSVSWRLADGVIQCSFSRPVKLSNVEPGRFDLDQEYFLFATSGKAHDGRIRKHHEQPLISTSSKKITGPPEILRGSHGPTLLKVHGALMLLAWMLTGSVGTFIASFYKPDWRNQTLFGQKVWFQVHRTLMLLTVVLTLAGFSLPFIYRGGWSEDAGAHAYLGCCVLALSVIQPIGAALRPPPSSDRRVLFNWFHWGIGYATEILAVAAMFLGVRQTSLPLPSPMATDIVIVAVVWLGVFRVLLVLHKHFYSKNASTKDDQQAILSDETLPTPRETLIKYLVLAALVLGNSGLLTALLSAIAEI